MKTRKILAFFTVLMLTTLASCRVESDNIFNMFEDVSVTFHDDSEYAVTDYRKFNDGDSVHISFTITSANRDMMKIVVDATTGTGGSNQRTEVVLQSNERRSYSSRLRFKMRRDGRATYRIYALDEKNVYMGDGYKSVTIEGAPSYTILADRKVYKPNPDKPELPTFYAIAQGRTYTYTGGSANSSDIDFGIYTLVDQTQANQGRIVFNLYSLSAEPNPYPAFDVSNWMKRRTLFSAPIRNAGGPTGVFNLALVSSSRIEEEAKKQNINQTQTSSTEYATALNAGTMLYFLTPEGKYGAILINQSTVDAAANDYVSISTKIQN